jgi:hypothetical protein
VILILQPNCRLGLNDLECGNPMKIVGNSFTTQQTARWTGSVVKT